MLTLFIFNTNLRHKKRLKLKNFLLYFDKISFNWTVLQLYQSFYASFNWIIKSDKLKLNKIILHSDLITFWHPLTLYPLSCATWQMHGQQSCSTAYKYLMHIKSAGWSFPFYFAALSHMSNAWFMSERHSIYLSCGHLFAKASPNKAKSAMNFILNDDVVLL